MNIPTNKLPEEKSTRGLEIAAIIVSGLLMIGIIVTWIMTMQWHALNKEKARRAMDEWYEQQMVKDSINSAIQAVTTIQNPSAHVDHETQKLSNEILYSMVETELDPALPAELHFKEALDMLKQRSDLLAARIELLKTDLDETLSQGRFVDETAETNNFFMAEGRAIELLNALKDYRKMQCADFKTAGVSNADGQANLMPLDDITPISGVESWDEYQFQNGPAQAKDYLDKLELQMRIFEGALVQQVADIVD